MINWNEVTVGETEICRPSFNNRKILGVFDDWVWLKDIPGDPCTYNKKELTHWTIYDPWEEITDECTINDYGNIRHNGHTVNYIDFEHGRYRRSEKGLHVWTRKGGVRDETTT